MVNKRVFKWSSRWNKVAERKYRHILKSIKNVHTLSLQPRPTNQARSQGCICILASKFQKNYRTCTWRTTYNEFVAISSANGRIHLHVFEKGHIAKTEGLKLVSHLKSDPLWNQIREFPLGIVKQTNKFDFRTNRFSHAYPVVCLPEDGLSSPKKGVVASLSKGRVHVLRLVWPDFHF